MDDAHWALVVIGLNLILLSVQIHLRARRRS
jgi:hypothetical protein